MIRIVAGLPLLVLVTVLGFVAETPGWTAADWAAAQVVQDVRNPFLTGVALFLNLGFGTEAGVVISLVMAVYTLVVRTPLAVRALLVVLAGWGLGALLKVVFYRPRPPAAFSMLGDLGDTSFPSGHVCLTAAVAVAAWVLVGRRWVIAVGVVLVVGQMLARVYLGVHYPTDVLAAVIAVAASSIIVLDGGRPRPRASREAVPSLGETQSG
ncbi:phosphatase PAP2 family protein [Herbidospora yilanensis]|uniref:phosphatase PAP2 family protein n=1 Tax=Herbidospora yilanensis TaxID=354426 RepID=UPI000782BE52|nr:phosphatase PAP2 family protein [Herbidospora yilanensis]